MNEHIEAQHTYDHQDYRLGRNVLHDRRSRNFPLAATVDRSTWRDKAVRIYDPLPNPNQCHGECTGVSKVSSFNAVGNRRKGEVLRIEEAHAIYSRASQIDPWEGSWPPDDTGSSTLGAAKAAQEQGFGGEYRWLFGGADEVIQATMHGEVVVVGSRWDWNMFNQDSEGRIRLGGGEAGGHAYIIRGYRESKDWALGRCWWGGFRDFWIARSDLDILLRDYGDAHVQRRI